MVFGSAIAILPHFALAATYPDQQIHNVSTTGATSYTETYYTTDVAGLQPTSVQFITAQDYVAQSFSVELQVGCVGNPISSCSNSYTLNLTGSANASFTAQTALGNGMWKIDFLLTGITLTNNLNINFVGGSGRSLAGNSSNTTGGTLSCNGGCGSVADMYITFNGGTIPSPTITFSYPQNGTTTPIFDNFWLTFSNVTTTSLYGIEITYDWNSTLDNPYNSPNYLSGYGQSLLHQGRLSAYQPFQGTNFAIGGGTTRGVTAYAYLFDFTDCGQSNFLNCPVLSSTSVNFNQYLLSATTTFIFVGPSIPTSTTSSTDGTYNVEATTTIPLIISINLTTSTTNCQQPDNITDIGGGIYWAGCQLTNALLNPNVVPQSTSYLNDSIEKFKQVPPFVAFFQAASTTESALTNASTSAGVSIGILGFNNEQRTIVSFNSTTFYQGFSNTNNSSTAKDAINYTETYIHAWLGLAALIKVLYVFLT